jgi:ADP-ribosylglycohydrolase
MAGDSDNAAASRSPVQSISQTRDRVKGAIFGAVYGSALGGSGIGLSHKDIAATVGLSGLREFAPGLSRSQLPDHLEGQFLADAYLGLAIGESLAACKGSLDENDLKARFESLLTDEKFNKSSAGVRCIAGMRNLVNNTKPEIDAPASLHANAVARVFAVGCLPGKPNSESPVDLAAAQARLTHGDDRAAAASAVIADSINYFIRGGRLDSAEEVKEYVRREFAVAQRFDERFAEAWDDVAPDLDYVHPAEELPYSLVNVESTIPELVPTAVGIFLIFRHNAEEAICAAARSGGDTDTVSTIVGAMAGAYHGFSNLPDRWHQKIAGRDRINALADALSAFWTS